jgi:hypothetical protein
MGWLDRLKGNSSEKSEAETSFRIRSRPKKGRYSQKPTTAFIRPSDFFNTIERKADAAPTPLQGAPPAGLSKGQKEKPAVQAGNSSQAVSRF